MYKYISINIDIIICANKSSKSNEISDATLDHQRVFSLCTQSSRTNGGGSGKFPSCSCGHSVRPAVEK